MPSVSSFFNHDHDDRDKKVLNRDPAGTGAWKLKYFAPWQILAPEPYFLPLNEAPQSIYSKIYIKKYGSAKYPSFCQSCEREKVPMAAGEI